jgi:hypothetical protein
MIGHLGFKVYEFRVNAKVSGVQGSRANAKMIVQLGFRVLGSMLEYKDTNFFGLTFETFLKFPCCFSFTNIVFGLYMYCGGVEHTIHD